MIKSPITKPSGKVSLPIHTKGIVYKTYLVCWTTNRVHGVYVSTLYKFIKKDNSWVLKKTRKLKHRAAATRSAKRWLKRIKKRLR